MTVSRKQARRAAAEAEAARRGKQAEKDSPLTRESLQALLDFVADRVATAGHTHSFELVEEFLVTRSLDPLPVRTFLVQHGVTDDFSLIVRGDPCRIFGPAQGRKAWMPIERDALEQLIAFVAERCEQDGCDHSHRFTREFLAQRSLPVGVTEMALLAQGGGCDCEVVLNVDAHTIFER